MDRAHNPAMVTIARNIRMITAKFNIHFSCQHIEGVVNHTADLLSTGFNVQSDFIKLNQLVPDLIWELDKLALCQIIPGQIGPLKKFALGKSAP